jgi:translation initiation factor RLI1
MHIKIDQDIQVGKKLIASFDLTMPGITVLQGANGVGKTTLFKNLKEVVELQKQAAFLDQISLSPLALMTVSDVFDCLQQELPQKVQGPWQQMDLLKQINITHLLDKPVSKLSGGENQLVKIVLCLYQKANIYLMDEPFHFLDAKNYQVIMDVIEKLAIEKGFFIIEHRNQDLLKMAHKVYELTSDEDSCEIKEKFKGE